MDLIDSTAPAACAGVPAAGTAPPDSEGLPDAVRDALIARLSQNLRLLQSLPHIVVVATEAEVAAGDAWLAGRRCRTVEIITDAEDRRRQAALDAAIAAARPVQPEGSPS